MASPLLHSMTDILVQYGAFNSTLITHFAAQIYRNPIVIATLHTG